MKTVKREQKRKALAPAKVITLSFALIIAIGSLLFTLPFMTRDGKGLDLLSAIFTTTSSVCVTGLTVIDPALTLTRYGQVLLALLIEIGGISLVTFVSFFLFMLKKKHALRNIRIAQEYTNADTVYQVRTLVKFIIAAAVSTQVIGAIILCFRFVPKYGGKGVWISIFTAISAYCNAGFDLFGIEKEYGSLINYNGDALVLYTVMALIIIGGLGFFVIQDLVTHKRTKHLTLHTKAVLTFTAVLISVGFVCILLAEFENPKTLGPMSIGEKLNAALFQSVTTRTAGFASIDIAGMHDLTKVMMMVLMFIGAGSGSTAGGIKITTFAVLAMAVISVLKNKDDAELFGRKIDRKVVSKSLAITVLGLICVFITSCVLLLSLPDANGIDMFFEAVSAFGTVGLSAGATLMLGPIGLCSLIVTMFIGRLGPICFMIALSIRGSDKSGEILPEGKIFVG